MKRFYLRVRIGFVTFAFGLASFWFWDGIFNGLVETQVDIPKVKSENVLVLFLRYNSEIPKGGGSRGRDYKFDILKSKKENFDTSKCKKKRAIIW